MWYGSLGQVSWDVVGVTLYSVDTQKLSNRKKWQRGKGYDAGTFPCRSCAFPLHLVITPVVHSADQSSSKGMCGGHGLNSTTEQVDVAHSL